MTMVCIDMSIQKAKAYFVKADTKEPMTIN